MQQILAYSKAAAAGAVLADLPAATDFNFSQRNGHYIFTEDYNLLAVAAFGVSLTAAQIIDPTYNAINIPQIYPVNVSLAPPSNPRIMDLRDMPVGIPLNEEIAVQASNNLATGTEVETVILWIAPRNTNFNLPVAGNVYGSYGRVRALVTFPATLLAGSWGGTSNLTFTNIIKGGTYAVLGAYMVIPNAIAYRWNFVRTPLYQGRKVSPGGLTENAYGNIPNPLGSTWLGVHGYFDTFELPSLQIFGAAAVGSTTYSGYLDLLYMGPNMLQNQPLIA